MPHGCCRGQAGWKLLGWSVEEPGLALGTAGLDKACAMHPVCERWLMASERSGTSMVTKSM